MSATVAKCLLNVAFEDGDNQEGLLYSGETIVVPLIHPMKWGTLCGTPIRFDATVVSVPGNILGSVKERSQCITLMKVYSGKSIDELRVEDYQYLNRPSSSSASFPTVKGGKKFKSAIEEIFPSLKSADSSTFSLIPKIDFTSLPTTNPCDVFSQSQPSVLGRESLQTLTVPERQQLMDSLLESIVKCMQIQNSLHRLVLLKLGRHVTAAEGHTDSDADSDAVSDLFKASGSESSREIPRALLRELKDPLEALMRCADIQRGLFQRMVTVNLMTTKESIVESSCDNQESHTDPQGNTLAVRSELEEITFKTGMECNYARNPFTCQHVMVSAASEDVVQHIPQEKRPLSSAACLSERLLPHGHGSLKTEAGKLIYCGDWKKGKRCGKGEGLIVTLTCNNPTAEHGFYTGRWKNNMRHGNGRTTFVSGAVYEGQWQYDKMTGYGTLKFPDGTIQEGTWNNGSLKGCVLFTWPHGVTEYREYDHSRGQVSSCKINKETAGKLSQMSSIRAQLSTLGECAAELKQEKLVLKDELIRLKMEQAEMTKKHRDALSEIHQNINVQREQECKKLEEEFGKKLKDAEESKLKSAERIRELENELEHSFGAQLCQICFEHPRDCIIMPCTHLLYCRTCVTEHKKKGDGRCPTCRGPISGEILCNINL